MSGRNRYTWMDRSLHHVAFSTRFAQFGAADLEERVFRKELERVTPEDPIFITALPRAGTTILLEVISKTKTIATHIYRDMPFVLCPMLWSRITRRFQKADTPRERMHGDGIHISIDSPEAFEEVVWKAFYRKRYRGATIDPWSKVDDAEFVEFLHSHMRKIIALRARGKPTARRYASKNNLNIARVPSLLDALPDASILVPFRDPVQHAASLLLQHQRFSKLHEEDRFARRYMEAIGHYDFGDHLKPVNFDSWFGDRDIKEAAQLGFWVEYWLSTYRHVLRHADHDRLHLIGFEALGASEDLSRLAEVLHLDAGDLNIHASVLRPAKTHAVDISAIDPVLVSEANSLYEELRSHCLLGA